MQNSVQEKHASYSLVDHYATSKFWNAYEKLPAKVQSVADENFELLKKDPFHPSLHFKKVGRFWSVRAGIKYRALGVRVDGSMTWFWIGSHADYDRLIS
ncbi:type II toxin-antitoxin system RelE/ParE family toxin [Rubritalea spongiae]|uniref:Type II toxin-antitoxin system RelE/ParE family toxin n=1 Tax=Rubritalea spongiae TaxID=430797 RepID=A0ABW5E3M9_9BACT